MVNYTVNYIQCNYTTIEKCLANFNNTKIQL